MQSSFSMSRHRLQEQGDYNLHIAIDWGTDGLGVAYAIKNNVYIQNKWSSNAYGLTIKPKCIALFDDNQQLISFGIDAKHDYIKLSPKQRESWMLFEQFKMSLYPNETDLTRARKEKVSINKVLTACNGRTMSSSSVFTAVFKFLYSNCMTWLKNKAIFSYDDEIEWIITVPAIWNDEAKNYMKIWAQSGGLTNIRIVYEPDCASLSMQYFMHKTRTHVYYDVKNTAKNIKKSEKQTQKLKFTRGDQYILIDVGGGTADIACHEILSKFGIKEILPPSGGKWGSGYIDHKFYDLLIFIFGTAWMNEFKLKFAAKHIELMNNFKLAKVECFKNKASKWHNIQLPLEFIEFLNDKCEQENRGDLEILVRNAFSKKDKKKVMLEDEYLKLNMKTWEYMFDTVMDALMCHVSVLLSKNIMKKCKYLCLVGGLSSSEYFQRRMREQFGVNTEYGLQIIVPKQPMLCVVEGAAYFGITKDYIRARRLSQTYGVRVNLSLPTAHKLGIPNEHIFNNLAFNADRNICHVRNCFEVMAYKGEEVLTNQVKIRKSKRLSGTQKSVIKYIMYSDKKDPKIIDDAFGLGEIKLDFGETIKDMVIHTEFHFYDTMLKVFVYPASAPDLKQEVELSYVDC